MHRATAVFLTTCIAGGQKCRRGFHFQVEGGTPGYTFKPELIVALGDWEVKRDHHSPTTRAIQILGNNQQCGRPKMIK